MRGCAEAGSTQARTLTCMSPPQLALHPCLDLYGFRVLSNSDRAPVFLFVLCTRPFRDWALPAHLSRPDGCAVWVGSGSIVLIEIEPAWRPSSLEAFGFLRMEPWLDASNPEHLNLSRPDKALQVVQQKPLGARPPVFFRCEGLSELGGAAGGGLGGQ